MLRRTRTTLFAFVLIMGAVVIGLYLAPSHKEIALMQMNDNDYKSAMKNFTTLHGEGDQSTNVLAPLISLNIHYGDVDKAIALLETYNIEHPNSIEGHKRLVQLYKSTHRLNEYCVALEELQTLSPSAANLRDLAETYDFLGRYPEEMEALTRLIDSKDYKTQEADYIRLASLYRVNQRAEDAISLIGDYVKDNDYEVGHDAIELPVQLMLEHGKNDRALSFAKDYLEKHENDETAALQLSVLFEMSSQFASAADIVRPFATRDNPSPALIQQLADISLALKKDNEVYAMLSARYEKEGTLTPSMAVTLTDLAVKRSDYAMIERLISSQDLEKLPEEALLRYADVAIRLKRPDLAKLIHSKLSAGFLHDAPVLAAVLEVAMDDNPKSMAAIDALPQNTILLPEARIILANLFLHHGAPARAFALVDNMPINDIIDAFDALLYAQVYLDANAGPKAEQILNKARAVSPPDVQEAIDQVMLLLAAGEGKAEFVKQALASNKEGENDFWPDAYDLALAYHHNEIALAVAEQLYKTTPSDLNRVQLGETLLLLHRYTEVMNLVQDLVEKDDDARVMYLESMASWILDAHGSPHFSSAQKDTIDKLIEIAKTNPKVAPDEKRDLAYILDQVGRSDQAEAILLVLAGDKPHDDPYVEDLLDFWQSHHWANAKDWLINRVHKAPTSSEKVVWLMELNDMGFPQAVADILRGDPTMPSSLADQYIEALATLHESQKLNSFLEKAIDTESDPARIRKLTVTAQDEDADSATEKGWRKLHELVPNDSQALLELGLIDFDAERFDESELLLDQYLQGQHDDYRGNYAYAEILQQDEKKEEAKPFYERALQQVSAIKDKNEDTLEDEAYLLYRADKVPQSIALFHDLLAKYPKDKDLRAAFVEVLMDAGRFEEAQALLAH